MTTFTGKKIDFLKAVRFDRTVSDAAFRVMTVVVDHLNERSGRTKLSDETIAFEGGMTPRAVRRARAVVKGRWLKWTRTGRTANIYFVNFAAAEPLLVALKEAREAKRQKFNETAGKSDEIDRKWTITPQTQQYNGQVRHD
jgi:hypothetical protein